jgi:hypothetical protein
MKCPKCDRELISDPNPRYNYVEPFIASKTHCSEHGYQPVPLEAAFRADKNSRSKDDH